MVINVVFQNTITYGTTVTGMLPDPLDLYIYYSIT